MAGFIPIEKIRKLREEAKAGDKEAKAILRMQMEGEDYSELLERHFRKPEEPKAEKGATLEQFLEYNDVHEGDSDYDETVAMFYEENPNLKPTDGEAPEMKRETAKVQAEIESDAEGSDAIEDLIKSAREFILACDKAIMELADLDDDDGGIAQATLKGAMQTLSEAKQNGLDILKSTKAMKKALRSKSELISGETEDKI